MTAFRVLVTDRALAAIDEQVAYVARERQAPLAESRLLGEIDRAIDTLRYFPHRCPRAPEDRLVEYDVRVRIVKKSYLLLFWIDEQRRAVTVVAFRHGRRSMLEDLPGE